MNWTPHPVLQRPSAAVLKSLDPDSTEDCAKLVRWHGAYHDKLRLAREDPYRHGFVLPQWEETLEDFYDVDETTILGGNRSTKSSLAAWLVVQALVKNPGSRIICWSQSDEISRALQQPYIYAALPKEFKKKRRDGVAKMVYSVSGGFTDKHFILPNGSHCIFKTYTQFANDNTCIEGIELGWKSLDGGEPPFLNLGNWFDEYLGDATLWDTIKFRLATRNSKNLTTFTPIHGYTPTIRGFLSGAETLKEVPAKLLGGELVPTVQRAASGSHSIRYFHTDGNPFNDYKRFCRDLEGKTREVILVRAYGIPTKAATTRFPKFQRHVNVKSHEEIEEAARSGTRYCLIDPAGSKNWFIVWISVDLAGSWHVYREWPDRDTHGPWADFGKPMNGRSGTAKWRPGQAQKGLGYGIKDYVELMAELEGKEKIYERMIDPRMGAAKYSAAVGQSSIIQDLGEEDCITTPAPGLEIEDGLQSIMSLMAYDDTKPIESMNMPHFYVSERCGNIISALDEYTGDDGKNEAHKDPIDCLRYGALSALDYVSGEDLEVVMQGGGGY